MKKKFTEGEWNACCLDDIPHFVFAGEKTVCAMRINERGKRDYEPMEATVTVDECVANAKLIQASPDLFDACVKMIQYFDENNLSECDAYYEMKKAIKKATE